MSCGVNDEIECAFRAEVEEDPHYKNLVAYLQIGEVHLPEANERRRLRAMAKKNIHFRMATFIIERRMENLSCVLLSQKYRQY